MKILKRTDFLPSANYDERGSASFIIISGSMGNALISMLSSLYIFPFPILILINSSVKRMVKRTTALPIFQPASFEMS